jgi:hypothetical protein
MTPVQRLNWVLEHSTSVIAIAWVIHAGERQRAWWKSKHDEGTQKGDQSVA